MSGIGPTWIRSVPSAGGLRRLLRGVVLVLMLLRLRVRILDGRDGTSATTRVLIDSTDGERRWSTAFWSTPPARG